MVSEETEFPWEGEFLAKDVALLIKYKYETLKYTKRFYAVRNPSGEMIMGAGVALWNFARPPEIYIMLCAPFVYNLRESFQLSKEALRLPVHTFGRVVCDVYSADERAVNFARKFGFTPNGQKSLRPTAKLVTQLEMSDD